MLCKSSIHVFGVLSVNSADQGADKANDRLKTLSEDIKCASGGLQSVTENLKSHSFRGGAGTFLSCFYQIPHFALAERGGWRDDAVNQHLSLSYVRRTLKKDAVCARALAEWEEEELLKNGAGSCPLLKFDHLNVLEKEDGLIFAKLCADLFCGSSDIKDNVRKALTSILIFHYSAVKEEVPHHPLILAICLFIDEEKILRWEEKLHLEFSQWEVNCNFRTTHQQTHISTESPQMQSHNINNNDVNYLSLKSDVRDMKAMVNRSLLVMEEIRLKITNEVSSPQIIGHGSSHNHNSIILTAGMQQATRLSNEEILPLAALQHFTTAQASRATQEQITNLKNEFSRMKVDEFFFRFVCFFKQLSNYSFIIFIICIYL